MNLVEIGRKRGDLNHGLNMENFSLNTIEQVKIFEDFSDQFFQKNYRERSAYIDLGYFFTKLQDHEDKNRIFTALFDLKLNFNLAFADLMSAERTWNEYFPSNKNADQTIFDSYENFEGRLKIHYHFSSYIFRHRAVLDKFMGLFLLLYHPDRYEAFISSKSKRSSFQKFASELSDSLKNFIDKLIKHVESFDRGFRTAEAHNTGKLRKYSLTMYGIIGNPLEYFLAYWNFLSELFGVLDQALRDYQCQ